MKTPYYKSTQKPRWYQLRWKLSNIFVNIARKIYPPNPEVIAFHMSLMADMLTSGKSVVRIDPSELNQPKAKINRR